jgi:hypothetical protein
MAKNKKKSTSLIQPPPVQHRVEVEHDSLKYGTPIDSADEISSGGVNQAEAGATGIIEEFPETSIESRYGGKP